MHPFTIKLNYDTADSVQPVVLGIDPGRTNIGLCAVDETGKPLFTAEVRTKNKDIPGLMAARRAFRMAHRKHRRRERRQRRAMKDMARHYPGCRVIRNGRVVTLLKRASGSYWFDDGMKSPVRKTDVTLNNLGLVFVSNTAT